MMKKHGVEQLRPRVPDVLIPPRPVPTNTIILRWSGSYSATGNVTLRCVYFDESAAWKTQGNSLRWL